MGCVRVRGNHAQPRRAAVRCAYAYSPRRRCGRGRIRGGLGWTREDRHVPGVPAARADPSVHRRRQTAATSVRCSPRQTPTTTRHGRPMANRSCSPRSAADPPIFYRVKADGSGLETADRQPCYDDQAAFSPTANSWRSSRRATAAPPTSGRWICSRGAPRALTSGPGGDFRPSWSPDGTWIAFSSIARATCRSRTGAGASAPRRSVRRAPRRKRAEAESPSTGISAAARNGPPTAAGVLAYCMDAEQTLDDRRAVPEHADDTRLRVD